jgi:hypothetical protein
MLKRPTTARESFGQMAPALADYTDEYFSAASGSIRLFRLVTVA